MKILAGLQRKVLRESFYLFAATYFVLNANFMMYPLSIVGMVISGCVKSSRAKYVTAMALGPFACTSVLWVLYGMVLHTTARNAFIFRSVKSLSIAVRIQAFAFLFGYFVKPGLMPRLCVAFVGVSLLRGFERPLLESRFTLEMLYRILAELVDTNNYLVLSKEYKSAIAYFYGERHFSVVDLHIFVAFLPIPSFVKFVCMVLTTLPLPRHAVFSLLLVGGAIVDSLWLCAALSAFSLLYFETRRQSVAVFATVAVYAVVVILNS